MSSKVSMQEALALKKTRVGKLTARLPQEEREEIGVIPYDEIPGGKHELLPREPANNTKIEPKREITVPNIIVKGKPIGVMVYLGEKEYEQLEEMLYRGKRFCRKATGLSLQQSELVARAVSLYYKEIYQKGDSFKEDVIALVESRRRSTQVQN